jgi:predicted nuclease of predicted toxin-antitoxin system
MFLLADENVPKQIVDMLRSEGNDVRSFEPRTTAPYACVLWARTDCSGWKDSALLDLAESEARIILTLDKDFWHIGLQRRVPLKQSGIVLFRIHPATSENLDPLVRTFVQADRAWAGQASIVAPDGIEMLSVGSWGLSAEMNAVKHGRRYMGAGITDHVLGHRRTASLKT